VNVISVTDTSIVTYNINGNTIYLFAQRGGTTDLRICDSVFNCSNLTVTVGESNYSNNSISFSQSNVSVNVGESASVSIYGDNYSSYYISNNSNSDIATVSLSNRTIYVTGRNSGNTSVTVCANNNYCGSLYISVSGSNYYGGNISLSISDVVLNVGQTYNVNIYGDNYNYFTATSYNSAVVSGNVSGKTLTLTAHSAGNASVKVCGQNYNYNYSPCASVSVTVTGNSNNTLNFSPASLTFAVNQSSTIYIQGGVAPYSINGSFNQNIISASISGSQIYLYGKSNGSTSLYVCGAYGSCGTIPIYVSGSIYSNSLGLPSRIADQLIPGYFYSVQLQATGGTAPYYYSVISGNLPSGLSMNSSGIISGYINAGTSGTFTVQVQDSQNRFASQSYTLSTSGGSVLGTNIYSNGTLINDNGTLYLTYKNTKTGFANMDAFRRLGYKLSAVINGSSAGLASSGYTVGSANTPHPWGSWISAGATIYFVHQDGLIAIPSYDIFIANGGQAKLVVPFNNYDIGKPLLSVMEYNDARLK
jgi:ferredoxin